MSLLSQFDLKPLGRTKRKSIASASVFFKNPEVGENYAIISLQRLLEDEGLEWPAFDAAFSAPHGGLVVAKGTTFKLRKDGRVSSKDICDACVRGFKIDMKGRYGIRIDMTATVLSEDVYVLKVETVEDLTKNQKPDA
jgi:hypothetical protein